ncbi:neurogenic locus Notch protein-like isoform X3 [Biomphalaria glabrata]|uniref:Neurogenic locus Notch protein-like isoform X3 n=1 Tax=Biomphalaria glabrata TaxID=6526 RepID=A0A9W2YX16_BIOGL|nr:neurogenic locus Notch protein-like isoform X3 [Biomphalaria glabrata]
MDKIVAFVVNLIIMITFLNKEWCTIEVSAVIYCSFVENYYADGNATNIPGTLRECQDRCISFSWCLGYDYFQPNCRLFMSFGIIKYRWPRPIFEKNCEDVCATGKEYKNNNCSECNIGFYKDENANSNCTKCPDHKITLGQGSSSITNCNITHCELGFYSMDNIFCLDCPIGTYKNFTGNQQCLHCPNYRTTTENGSTDITNCSFAHCVPGFYLMNNISCIICPNGTYKNFTGNQACLKCPKNRTTTNVGAIDISNCSYAHCEPGFYSSDNISCSICPNGTYKDFTGNQPCSKCPSDKTTTDLGATDISNCSFAHCEPGFYSEDNISCSACTNGTYKQFTGSQSCLKCPLHKTTSDVGSTEISHCSITNCEPGFYSRDNISCSICPNGTYKNFFGTQPCSKCPMNKTTREVGSTDISNCSLDCPKICIKNDPCKYTGTSTCVCLSGYYGTQCSKRCSPGCLDDSCNRLDGTCPCKEGYFDDKCLKTGKQAHNNQWNSHCKENCSEERNFKFDLCYIGWFGDSCLYKDLGVDAIMDDKVLNDNNDSTCVKRNNVTINWQLEIQAITWIRLVFTSNDDVREITAFYFNNNNDTNASLVCNSVDMRYRKVGNTSMDFHCDGSYFVSTVQISWQSESLLCSVHVNGARKVRWSLSEYKWINIETLTDGYYGRDGCLTMNSGITLELLLWHEVYSAQVLLYTDFSRDDGRGLYSVELIDAYEKVQSKMFSSGKDVFVQTAFFNSFFVFRSVNIRVLSGKLDICELEIYGDCISPYYGYSCLDICYLACLHQDCTYSGECYECTPGRTGTYCEDSLYNSTDFVTEAARQSSTEARFSVAKVKSVINKYAVTLIVCVLTILTIFIGKKCLSSLSDQVVSEEEE